MPLLFIIEKYFILLCIFNLNMAKWTVKRNYGSYKVSEWHKRREIDFSDKEINKNKKR